MSELLFNGLRIFPDESGDMKCERSLDGRFHFYEVCCGCHKVHEVSVKINNNGDEARIRWTLPILAEAEKIVAGLTPAHEKDLLVFERVNDDLRTEIARLKGGAEDRRRVCEVCRKRFVPDCGASVPTRGGESPLPITDDQAPAGQSSEAPSSAATCGCGHPHEAHSAPHGVCKSARDTRTGYCYCVRCDCPDCATPSPSAGQAGEAGTSNISEELRDTVALAHLRRGCDEVTPLERRAICKWAATVIESVPSVAIPKPVEREARWRTGRKVGRTIYCDDVLVGMMDTPAMAANAVACLNRVTGGEVSTVDRVALAEALMLAWCGPGTDTHDYERSNRMKRWLACADVAWRMLHG